MSEDVIAETQYGDFEGTISADGHDGSSPVLNEMARLASVSPAYMPVGFSMYRGQSSFQVTVYAIDRSSADIGPRFSLVDYAAAVSHLPVFEFSVGLSMEKFFDLFKRFHVVATVSSIAGKPMKSLGNHSG